MKLAKIIGFAGIMTLGVNSYGQEVDKDSLNTQNYAKEDSIRMQEAQRTQYIEDLVATGDSLKLLEDSIYSLTHYSINHLGNDEEIVSNIRKLDSLQQVHSSMSKRSGIMALEVLMDARRQLELKLQNSE